MVQTYVLRDKYYHEHACITIDELRALLQHAHYLTPLWMFIVLAVTCGLRCDELLQLTTYNVRGFTTIQYTVEKPKRNQKRGVLEITRKHRTVTLDPWVSSQLKAYYQHNFTRVGDEWYSPFRDTTPNKHGQMLSQKLFPWKNVNVVDAMMYKLRKALCKEGFDAMRVETMSTSARRQHHVLVVRVHKLRHMALSIHYIRHGHNLKVAQEWIRHERSQTTDRYVHSAATMGTTEEFLQHATWPDILNCFNESATHVISVKEQQTSLNMF